MLVWVFVVNQYGYCVYDYFVWLMEEVVDYCIKVSGVCKYDFENGMILR